jgi:long-chain acyl-CoA synthetase
MNVLYFLRRARDIHGSSIAVLDGDSKLTYREFYERVHRVASFLDSIGLSRGERASVILSNSPAYLELYYALPMAGGIIVPLNNRWGIDDFVFSITDSGSTALIVDDRFADIARQIAGRVPGLRLVYAGRGDCPNAMIDYHAGTGTAAPVEFDEPSPEDLAGIFYTSGTTGGPKGAMLTHRNVCSNAVLCLASGLGVGAVYLHAAPMFHLADGAATHSTTATGAAHAFIEAFEPGDFLRAVEKYRVSASVLVPTMINMVVNHPDLATTDLSSLDRILYGASPMPLPLLKTAMEKLGCRFQQAYGMTETSPVLTILRPEDHRFDNAGQTYAPVRSAGRPILGMEVRVVDVEDRDVAPGEVGEIIARGDNVMKGYWKRPEISAEVLRGGWMHTGDMGTFDENGYLYILDRKKDMIKTGGENVYSPEVESMLISHDAVLEAAVIGMPHPVWGETIRAIVVRRPGAGLTEHELIEYCRERMTHFKCPTSVVFLDALPKGGTGKVQKTVLRRMYGGPAAATA